MKNNGITFIMILLFFVGLSLLLYPSISNYYNQKIGTKAIVDYEAILKKSGDYLVVFVNTGCDYCELYKPLINSYAMKENSLNVYVLDFSILEKSE